MNKNVCAVLTCIFALVALILAALILARVSKKKSESYAKKVRWAPPPPQSEKTWSVNDQEKCAAAFAAYGFDDKCQQNPNADPVTCSAYPVYYCEGQGILETGDLNSTCPSGSAIAYEPRQCASPNITLAGQGFLCGGPVLPSCGMCPSKLQAAPYPAPYGATNFCPENQPPQNN